MPRTDTVEEKLEQNYRNNKGEIVAWLAGAILFGHKRVFISGNELTIVVTRTEASLTTLQNSWTIDKIVKDDLDAQLKKGFTVYVVLIDEHFNFKGKFLFKTLQFLLNVRHPAENSFYTINVTPMTTVMLGRKSYDEIVSPSKELVV